MNSKILILVVAFALLCTVGADDDEKKDKNDKKCKGKGHKFMCKGTEIKFDEDHKKAMGECWKEMKERKEKGKKDADAKDDEKKHFKPDACFAACKLNKMKAVVDGKFDVSVLNTWIEKALPSEVQKDAKAGIQKCADEVKDTTFSMDDDCKSYAKLGLCQMKAIKEPCKNKNDDDA